MKLLIGLTTATTLVSTMAQAQVTLDGCVNAQGTPVASIRNDGVPDVAIATQYYGQPVIFYNVSVLAWLQPATRLFIYAHECGHHNLGHTLVGSHPLTREQAADCWAIRTLVESGLVNDSDLRTIQRDIEQASRGDWTHLPGPQRSMNLVACLGGGVTRPQAQRPFCCDVYGIRRCVITMSPGPEGSPCACAGIPGIGMTCR